jgi:hypothetical protein
VKLNRVKLNGNEVFISVLQWGKSLGEQGVLCTIITRRYVHIRITVHMAISFIILLYIPVSFYFVISLIRLLDLCRTKPLLVLFA